MTNKIEITRELAERWLDPSQGSVYERYQDLAIELRTLLDAPVVDRQPVEVLGYSVVGNRYAIAATKGEIIELHEGYADHMIELVDRKHVSELQATIARLTADLDSERTLRRNHAARIHELSDALKGGQGEPVYLVRYRDGYVGWRNVEKATYDDLRKDANYESRTLYTSQPAPVSVVLPRNPEKLFLEWASSLGAPPTQMQAFIAGIDKVKGLNQ